MNYKPLFSRALGLDPERLHFAAHSHHLWPDVSFDGQVQAWAEANRFADRFAPPKPPAPHPPRPPRQRRA